MAESNIGKEDDIQKQILQAALQLFQAHGFRRVTMDDVAKAIGKGRSSLYYYYKSKVFVLALFYLLKQSVICRLWGSKVRMIR